MKRTARALVSEPRQAIISPLGSSAAECARTPACWRVSYLTRKGAASSRFGWVLGSGFRLAVGVFYCRSARSPAVAKISFHSPKLSICDRWRWPQHFISIWFQQRPSVKTWVIFSSFFEPSRGQQVGKRIRYINSLSHFRAIKLCLFTWKHFEEPNILVGRANDAFSVKKGELRSPIYFNFF